ncbi:MAG: hypothetical protein KC776_17470 [Myxococcales bacterium]|nr:hypothetical protein [Myxococcales bacterium]MCB9577986.1 hypothetical protein [Polyangiaceae bacterium]
MNDRNKGLTALLVSAAAAGVYIEATRDRSPAPTPAPSASVSVSASVSAKPAPPRAATPAEIERTIATLSRALKTPAGDPQNPWGLAHGLVAFGKDFETTDGQKAVDVIASYAELTDGHYGFPAKKGDQLVEPHRALQVKTLLEVGVPLDRELRTSDGKTVTLARLLADLRASATLPETDAQWHQAAWLLGALVLADEQQGDAGASVLAPDQQGDAGASVLAPDQQGDAGASFTARLARAALDRLEKDQRVCVEYAGDAEHAFAPGSPLRKAKTEKTGIYGHSCGGLHLVQAVLRAHTYLDTHRVQAQLGVLLFRYEAERAALKDLLQKHPEQGLILRIQELKFFGHLVETFALARRLGLVNADTEGGKRILTTLGQAAGDVVTVVAELDQGGVFQRLDAIRRQRKQSALDLVGDGCHALRGLRWMTNEK